MHDSELLIFKGLINRKIKGLTMVRCFFELHDNTIIRCFGEILLSFEDFDSKRDTHYIGIDPRPSGGSGNKLYFLTQWKYVGKPLAESIYFPSQKPDSKFKSGFGCSHLGKVKNITLVRHIHNSGLLRLDCENGSMNIIIRDQNIEVEMDGSKSLDQLQEAYFESEKGTELLRI